ncbi:hypothetical protein Barb4_04326 [Bacteroidales bacterium Barb4]|nr:hypothetical protein Barb4_04326 [Bacteroidales bacterium Barb4]
MSVEEQAGFRRIENFLEKDIYKIPLDAEFGTPPPYEPDKNAFSIYDRRPMNGKKNRKER